MVAWEYRVLYDQEEPTSEVLLEKLGAEGLEGWEFVTYGSDRKGNYMVLKRAKGE